MQINDGRQEIAIRWFIGLISNESKYKANIHNVMQKGYLSRALGEISEVYFYSNYLIHNLTFNYRFHEMKNSENYRYISNFFYNFT